MEDLAGVGSALWHALYQCALPIIVSGYLGILTSRLFVDGQNPKTLDAWVRFTVTLLVTTAVVYGLLQLGSSRFSLWGPAPEYTLHTGTAIAALCNLVRSIFALYTYKEGSTRKTVFTGRDLL
jgi:ABC-type phosphate transport system permease subunit